MKIFCQVTSLQIATATPNLQFNFSYSFLGGATPTNGSSTAIATLSGANATQDGTLANLKEAIADILTSITASPVSSENIVLV